MSLFFEFFLFVCLFSPPARGDFKQFHPPRLDERDQMLKDFFAGNPEIKNLATLGPSAGWWLKS